MAKQEKTKKTITIRSMSELSELGLILENETENENSQQQDAFAQRTAYQEWRNPTYNMLCW